MPGSVWVNIGSGLSYWDGWVNIDNDGKYKVDIKAEAGMLPIEDGCADVVCGIHLIEHFYHWEAEEILKEWKRVLKVGGKLILELPSMDKVFSYLLYCLPNNIDPNPAISWFALWGDPGTKDEGMCHKWGYSAHMMQELLEKCGFLDIKFLEPKYHFIERDMRFEATKGDV